MLPWHSPGAAARLPQPHAAGLPDTYAARLPALWRCRLLRAQCGPAQAGGSNLPPTPHPTPPPCAPHPLFAPPTQPCAGLSLLLDAGHRPHEPVGQPAAGAGRGGGGSGTTGEGGDRKRQNMQSAACRACNSSTAQHEGCVVACPDAHLQAACSNAAPWCVANAKQTQGFLLLWLPRAGAARLPGHMVCQHPHAAVGAYHLARPRAVAAANGGQQQRSKR